MDSHDDLGQILEQLEKLKNQTLEYSRTYLKGEIGSRLNPTKLQQLFKDIKEILEGKSDPFTVLVKNISDGQKEFPGHKARLMAIEGIGKMTAQKLMKEGITTSQSLLATGATVKGRKALAERTGISEKIILEWVNVADLFRIQGVGKEYASLLENSGVDTIPDLAVRNPENLYKKLVEVNNEKNLVRQLPGKTMVTDWVGQAKGMDRIIKY